mmetsp:Transcript_13372/g.21984  ORF Transcript_13372/g.21984 Transcript_13372/m.21984 type:complete len:229 (-) Transcript_13372:28-714(-)
MAESAIVYLAVARANDKALLATNFDKSALSEEKNGYERSTVSMLDSRASKVFSNWKDAMDCDTGGKLFALADAEGNLIFIAGVRDSQYPERVVQQLLKDFIEKANNSQGADLLNEARPGSLSKPLKNIMKDLMSQYGSAASNDKTTEVRQQVDQLKGIMQANVKRILETHATLDQLQNSSAEMSSEAQQFLRSAKDLRRQEECRNLKVKVVLGICVSAVAGYFVLPFL